MSDETPLDKGERIVEIEMERLRDFRNHPFKIMEDQEMKALMDSIRQYGILNPIIVRPLPEGIYEIIRETEGSQDKIPGIRMQSGCFSSKSGTGTRPSIFHRFSVSTIIGGETPALSGNPVLWKHGNIRRMCCSSSRSRIS